MCPNNESMSAIALAFAAGGGIKSGKTTVLMTGTEGVGALKKAEVVGKTYTGRPISKLLGFGGCR